VRSAGTFAQILQKDNQYVTITLPSGEHRNIPLNCKACFGSVSNDNHQNVLIKKAGRSR
jgi:large subunit ribosomal protein L2